MTSTKLSVTLAVINTRNVKLLPHPVIKSELGTRTKCPDENQFKDNRVIVKLQPVTVQVLLAKVTKLTLS